MTKWTESETILVRAFAYMVRFKQVSVYKATNDIMTYWLRNRSWESIRSHLNRQRKAMKEGNIA